MTCSTSSPPTIGPSAVDTDEIIAQIPTAIPNFLGGNTARSNASVFGISIAPNSPWTARKAMTPSIDPASPIATDATVNPATPTR
ncbi:hypothetical protein a10_06851 [Streptomyces acidiscabies]|nr:hypothetical protein a10_06851 [Streptomyces acidiscabies]